MTASTALITSGSPRKQANSKRPTHLGIITFLKAIVRVELTTCRRVN